MGRGLQQRILRFYDAYGIDGRRCSLPLHNHISIIEKNILPALSADQQELALEKTVELLARYPSRDRQVLAMLAVSALHTDGRADLMGSTSYLGMCLADLRAHANRHYRTREEEWLTFEGLYNIYTRRPELPNGDLALSL